MYRLVDESESHRYRSYCARVLTETCEMLREEGINAQFVLVGSGARNLITRNGDGPYDLDYNLVIIAADPFYMNDPHQLKEKVRSCLNAAEGNYFSDAQDSTAVLTCLLHFNDTPKVEFSFDVAIVRRNKNGNLMRLIHNKKARGFGPLDQYTWNEVPSSHNVSEKADEIKNAGKWQLVRDRYEDKKNEYLECGDTDHPSFIVYVETVNEIYAKLKAKQPTASKTVKAPQVSPKMEFNNKIQQILSKTKQYDNATIAYVASLACENYSGSKNKKVIQNELRQKFGAKAGNDLYTRIATHLK